MKKKLTLFSFLIIFNFTYSQEKLNFKKYYLGENIKKYKSDFTYSGIEDEFKVYYYSGTDTTIKSLFGINLSIIRLFTDNSGTIKVITLVNERPELADGKYIYSFYNDKSVILESLSKYYGEPYNNSTKDQLRYEWNKENYSILFLNKHYKKNNTYINQFIVHMMLSKNKKIIDDF
jgi:hypothetical protein